MKYRDIEDLNSGRFRYDPALHSDEDMVHAIYQLFSHVYTDLAAGCDQEDLDEHFESMSLPAFIDYLGDTLHGARVPSEKIDEIQAWCRSGGRMPNRLNHNEPKVFTFKEFTR